MFALLVETMAVNLRAERGTLIAADKRALLFKETTVHAGRVA